MVLAVLRRFLLPDSPSMRLPICMAKILSLASRVVELEYCSKVGAAPNSLFSSLVAKTRRKGTFDVAAAGALSESTQLAT